MNTKVLILFTFHITNCNYFLNFLNFKDYLKIQISSLPYLVSHAKKTGGGAEFGPLAMISQFIQGKQKGY